MIRMLSLLILFFAVGCADNPTGPTSVEAVPPAPKGVKVTNGPGAYISWEPVKPTTYTSIGGRRALPVPTYYNIYWSTAPGVTKKNGNKIPGVLYPQHFNPDFYAPVYYIRVTAFNKNGESELSEEVSSVW